MGWERVGGGPARPHHAVHFRTRRRYRTRHRYVVRWACSCGHRVRWQPISERQVMERAAALHLLRHDDEETAAGAVA